MKTRDIFKKLGAPLRNFQTSWGAVRDDGVVFLKVWQNEVKKFDDVQHVMVISGKHLAEHPEKHGYSEREKHLELIRQGARCYLVFCIPKSNGSPEKNSGECLDDVFEAGSLVEIEGGTWIQLGKRVKIEDVTAAVS